MPSTSPDDIPTLSDLYSKGKLAGSDEPLKYEFDESINDRVSIWRGDITHLASDVIVNAANKSLLGGGGVDGAIHRAAGPGLLRECKTLGGANTGETKFTKAYDLPSKWVAHTVGPIYGGATKSAGKLRSCYETSLQGCKEHGGGSIGFSSISTGVYGYPIVDATKIALETTRRFLEKDQSISRVIYVVFSEKDEIVYRSLASQFFPGPDTGSKRAKTEHSQSQPKDVHDNDDPNGAPDADLVPSSQKTVVDDMPAQAKANKPASPGGKTTEETFKETGTEEVILQQETKGEDFVPTKEQGLAPEKKQKDNEEGDDWVKL